jgi:glucose-1-phosphate thymidylyltransferase
MAAGKPNRGLEPEREMVGILPAAGKATRIAPLPCSKELYPIGFRPVADDGSTRPKVASHYVLEKMRFAGITKVYIVLRQGKWDIPNYFSDGSLLDMKLAYLITKSSLGPPYTLDQAYPFVRKALVAFGFPDIIFKAKDVYQRLLMRQSATGADVVLGLFPAREPREVDMVAINDHGQVRSIAIKPRRTRLHYTWIVAVWTPAFSRFMHSYLKRNKPERISDSETSVGHVFQAAIAEELRFEGVVLNDNTWIDIGRPHDLIKAVRNLA